MVIIESGRVIPYFAQKSRDMLNESISPFSRPAFEFLANRKADYCVSIYLPMDLKGQEQNKHLAQAKLKQCLKDVQIELAERKVNADEIFNLLHPVEALLSNVELWRNPSEGLAIFLSEETEMQYHLLPLEFEQLAIADRHFHLSPLLPLYHTDGRYYLLELSQDYIRLYEASRNEFRNLHLEQEAPGQLEDAVGYDYEQKQLQFRSGQGSQAAMFHGQGAGKDDERKELITFLRMVDEGVNKKINDKTAPLVLSCVDEIVPLYNQVNSYPNLYKNHVSGDPEFKKDDQRHRESWEVIASYFGRTKDEKRTQFREQYHTHKVAVAIEDIVPAAINGKIDTLFIARGPVVYGSYDEDKNTIRLDKKKTHGNSSLTELAAIKTFLQGGYVYFLPPEEMPEKETPMNALYRY